MQIFVNQVIISVKNWSPLPKEVKDWAWSNIWCIDISLKFLRCKGCIHRLKILISKNCSKTRPSGTLGQGWSESEDLHSAGG